MNVHTGTIYLCTGLWHKGCMKTVALCDGTHCHLEGHDTICHLVCSCEFEIDLMLRRSSLMMGRLYLISHILQSQNHITSCIFSKIKWADIQISGFFVCQCGRHSVVICVEQEKLTFRVYLADIAFLCGHINHLLQNVSRAFLKRGSVTAVDIADQSGYFSLLRTPRKNGEGIVVRMQIHILLLFSGDSCNVGAVYHILIVKCPGELPRGNRNIF